MPTAPAHANFIRTEFRIVPDTVNAAIQTAFGALARRTDEPIETYFETQADAQAMRDQRKSLYAVTRRRLSYPVLGVDRAMNTDYIDGTITVRAIDDEKAVNTDAIISKIGIDFGRDNSKFEVWG